MGRPPADLAGDLGLADVSPGARMGSATLEQEAWGVLSLGDYIRPADAFGGVKPWTQVSPGQLTYIDPDEGAAVLARQVPSLVPGRAPTPQGSTLPGPAHGESGPAVIVATGRTVCCGVPIFRNFQACGHAVWREYLDAIVERLLPDRLVRCGGGPNVEAAVHRGPPGTVVHLLQWSSERWPRRHMYPAQAPRLAPVSLSVRAEGVRRVRVLPDGPDLDFEPRRGRVEFDSGPMTVHQAILLG
jgi:hypothetical protein